MTELVLMTLVLVVAILASKCVRYKRTIKARDKTIQELRDQGGEDAATLAMKDLRIRELEEELATFSFDDIDPSRVSDDEEVPVLGDELSSEETAELPVFPMPEGGKLLPPDTGAMSRPITGEGGISLESVGFRERMDQWLNPLAAESGIALPPEDGDGDPVIK